GDVTGPCRVVIGIGLNVSVPVNAARVIDQPFTDLASHSGEKLDRNQVLAVLIEELAAGLADFEALGFPAFYDEWQEGDVYKGRSVVLSSGANVVEGVARGVNEAGALLLETAAGVRVMTGGEMSSSLRMARDES